MAHKFTISTLGNPAAAAVAVEILKDKELRHETGSAINKVLKVTGIAIGATVLFFVGRSIAKKMKAKHAANKALKAATHGLDKKELSKDKSWYAARVDDLVKYLNLNDPCLSENTREYDEGNVVNVIKQCENKHDWLMLCKEFGTKAGKVKHIVGPDTETEPRSLSQWLSLDGDSDKAKYNEALKKIEADLIN